MRQSCHESLLFEICNHFCVTAGCRWAKIWCIIRWRFFYFWFVALSCIYWDPKKSESAEIRCDQGKSCCPKDKSGRIKYLWEQLWTITLSQKCSCTYFLICTTIFIDCNYLLLLFLINIKGFKRVKIATWHLILALCVKNKFTVKINEYTFNF